MRWCAAPAELLFRGRRGNEKYVINDNSDKLQSTPKSRQAFSGTPLAIKSLPRYAGDVNQQQHKQHKINNNSVGV
jgi:hypothetical protein